MAEQLGKWVAPKAAAAPGSPVTGQVYYDTGTNTLLYWNGTTWVNPKGEKGEPGTAAGAYSTTIGDGVTTEFTITHSLGTRAVLVGVRSTTTPWQETWRGYTAEAISTTQIRLKFDVAPTTGQFLVVIQSGGGKEGPKGETGPPGSGVTKAEVEAIAVLKALLTTKGDLIAATASATPARLAVGVDGAALIADSASTPGVKWGSKNYGIVTSLPTSPAPAVGDRCAYKAATGVYWLLVYTGEATYPWAKVGGPPLFHCPTGSEVSTESETPQTTNAPKIVAPLAMEFTGSMGAAPGTSSSTGQSRMRLYVNAAASVAGDAVYASIGGNFTGAQPIYKPGATNTGATAALGNAIEARYFRGGGSGKANFFGIYLFVDPIRVG